MASVNRHSYAGRANGQGPMAVWSALCSALLLLAFLSGCGPAIGGTPTTRMLAVTISPEDAGYVAGDPDQPSYPEGTFVTLNATSASGWMFDHWEGNLSGSTNPAGLTMDAEKQVTAVFTAVPLEMVSVPGGTFQMGLADYAPSQPVHTVTVSSFLIARHEVTQAQYREVMGVNPSCYQGDDSRPVEWVKWLTSLAFCNALSDREGLQRCYTIFPTSATCDFTGDGYRLPTEAEWEFAAQGGTASQGYVYSGSNNPDDVAWYNEPYPADTHPVGMKAPNELGLCDMSGNVMEWCWDWRGVYGSGAQTDPTGPGSGTYHVVRGGSLRSSASDVRPGYRDGYDIGVSIDILGFRVARRGS